MSLLPNTIYYARVKAVNSTQESDYSNTIQITTLDGESILNPLPASQPTIYKIIPYSNKVDVILQLPNSNEYISNLKVRLSTNSDFSSPLYNDLTLVIDENTQTYIENNEQYLLFSLTKLNANTIYYIRLRYSNINSISSNLDTSFSTDVPLKSPSSIGATNLTSITADVNWTAVNSATTYFLDVATDNTFNTLVLTNQNTGNVTSYTLNVLTENTTYYYRVRSNDGTFTSKNSNITTFKTLNAIETEDDLSFIPIKPTLLRIKNLNNTSAVIELSVENNNIINYDLSTSSNFSSFVLENQTTVNYTLSLTSLTANTVYYLRVRSVKTINDNTNRSDYTLIVFTTLEVNNSLNPPQILNPSTIFTTGLILNWVKRTYANRYQIQISTAINFSTLTNEYYVGDIDSLLLDGLTPNTLYYVRIYALNNTQKSLVSNVISVTTLTSLASITLLDSAEVTDYSIKLNWTTNNAYIRYLLTIYKSTETNNYLGDGFFFNKNVNNVSSYTVDLFLEANTTYSYYLTGVTSTGDTNSSSIGTFTTKAKAPSISFSNDLLVWNGNLNRLEVSTDKDFKFLDQRFQSRTVLDADKQYYIGNLLEDNKNYFIRGYFNSNGLNGLYSNVLNTFNESPYLLKPDLYKTYVNIKWKKGKSTNYKIQIKQLISGNYVPITGHSIPIEVGNASNFIQTGLTANTSYSVQISYLKSDNTYSSLSLPLYFKTNQFDNVSELTTNGTLGSFSVTNAVSYDKFTLTFPNTYTKYLVEQSIRTDFPIITNYFEVVPGTYTYSALENSNYYFKVYGVAGTDKTNPQSISITTSNLPAYPSVNLSNPSITAIDILNPNEVLISFTNVSSATGYTIEISEVNTFNVLVKGLSIISVTNNKVLVSGLVPTKTYYVRIYAFNENSLSGYSSTSTIDTSP